MRLKIDASPIELQEKGDALIKALMRSIDPVCPELAERLEKALPEASLNLRYPALREIHEITKKEYQKTLDAIHLDISRVLDEAAHGTSVGQEFKKAYVPELAQESNSPNKAIGGPFIGPRGGKWADPQHTIPWDEPSAASHNGTFRYGAALRPVSYANVPKGAKHEPHEAFLHGQAVYDRPLTADEIKSYELTPILNDRATEERVNRVLDEMHEYADEYRELLDEDPKTVEMTVRQALERQGPAHYDMDAAVKRVIEGMAKPAEKTASADPKVGDSIPVTLHPAIVGGDGRAEQAPATPTGEPPTPQVEHSKAVQKLAGKTTADERGLHFETGKPVEFTFSRNLQKAPKAPRGGEDTFQQKVEPAGRYMQAVADDTQPLPTGIVGKIKFNKPIVLQENTKPGGRIYDENSWKANLSAAYGGKKGKALSQAIAKDGYDGIVTVGKYGTGEIVDLRFLHTGVIEKALPFGDLQKAYAGPFIGPRGGKWADPEHTIHWEDAVPHEQIVEQAHAAVKEHVTEGAMRAAAAGADAASLKYVGSGGEGMIFEDNKGRAYKVSRHQTKARPDKLRNEAEAMMALADSPVAHMVPKVYGYDEKHDVISRDMIQGASAGWGQSSKMHEAYKQIAAELSKRGWYAPEFKEGSFSVPQGGGDPVMVDMGFVHPKGEVLAAHLKRRAENLNPEDDWFDFQLDVSHAYQDGAINVVTAKDYLERGIAGIKSATPDMVVHAKEGLGFTARTKGDLKEGQGWDDIASKKPMVQLSRHGEPARAPEAPKPPPLELKPEPAPKPKPKRTPVPKPTEEETDKSLPGQLSLLGGPPVPGKRKVRKPVQQVLFAEPEKQKPEDKPLARQQPLFKNK